MAAFSDSIAFLTDGRAPHFLSRGEKPDNLALALKQSIYSRLKLTCVVLTVGRIAEQEGSLPLQHLRAWTP